MQQSSQNFYKSLPICQKSRKNQVPVIIFWNFCDVFSFSENLMFCKYLYKITIYSNIPDDFLLFCLNLKEKLAFLLFREYVSRKFSSFVYLSASDFRENGFPPT